MKRLIIKPADADVETDRVTAILSTRRAIPMMTVRHDHPAMLIVDALKLRREINPETAIHAFGMPALATAIIASRGEIVFSPVGYPSRRQIGWLRAASAYRSINILCNSDTMRRRFVTRGLASDRCHLARPGVKFADIPKTRDPELRRRLGFSESDIVLFVPFEITHDSGHLMAMWACSILQIIQPEYKLLIWGRGTAGESIGHVRNRIINPRMITFATDIDPSIKVEALFGAANAVLMTPSGNVSPMIVAMAMASGRPIVATTTQQLCELIEDRHTALLVKKPTQRFIAQRVMDLFADPALAWQLQDRARAEAYDYLTTSKFLEACDIVYAKVAARHSADSPTSAKPSEA